MDHARAHEPDRPVPGGDPRPAALDHALEKPVRAEGRLRRPRQLRAVLLDARARPVGLPQPVRVDPQHRHHRPPCLRIRLRAHSLVPAPEGPLQEHRPRADPRPVTLAGHRARLSLRQPGADQGAALRTADLRSHRRRDGGGLLHLPACPVDHRDGAVPGRRAPVRGGGRLAREAAAHLLERHAPRRPLRPDQRRLRRVHHGDHRLRRPQGHRRTVQRAGHRHLQAGHRPAQLRDGRGGQRDPADSRCLRLRRRPARAAPPGGAPVDPGGALRAETELSIRPRDARLLRRDRRVHPRDGRDLPVRGPRQVLPVQPDPDPLPLRL